jgi:hypothetical protein
MWTRFGEADRAAPHQGDFAGAAKAKAPATLANAEAEAEAVVAKARARSGKRRKRSGGSTTHGPALPSVLKNFGSFYRVKRRKSKTGKRRR